MFPAIDQLLDVVKAFSAPAVIVAFISTFVGSILTYLGIRLNRKKEAFETHRYARSIFRELFELNGKVDERLAEFRTTFSTMFPAASLPPASTMRELLLRLDEASRLKEHNTSPAELKEFASKVSGFHYSNQAQRILLIHSIAELLDHHSELLNSFEMYTAYHAILVAKDEGFGAGDQWLRRARKFYADMKKTGDYSTMVRMGITLTGVETERGLLKEASQRLRDLGSPTVIDRSGFEPNFLRRRFEYLARRIDQASQQATGGDANEEKVPAGGAGENLYSDWDTERHS